MRIVTTATLLSLALPLDGERALAQQTHTQISVNGGLATDQRGVRSSALTVAPAVTLQSRDAAFGAGASATRFATHGWSLGATVSASTRRSFARALAVSLSASGSASRLSSDGSGTFAVGDILPALEATAGPLTLYAGGRAAAGRASQQRIQRAGPIFGPPDIVGEAVTTATRIGPVYGASVGLTGSLGAIHASARHEPAEGITTNVGASVAIARQLTFDIAAGRHAENRLIGTPAGSYATAGLSFRLGQRHMSSLPRPVGVRPPRPGMTRLSLRAADARVVELAGDFTDWKFVRASRAPNGVWYVDLQIAPGQYRYAFRIDGTEWLVPDGATAVDDGFGGTSAWLTVPDGRVGR